MSHRRRQLGITGSQFFDFRPVPALFTNVRAEPKPVPKVVLTVQDMVMSLRDNGLPISAIAEIAKVERKIYSWLDGTDVRETNAARVETLFRLLDAAVIDYRSLHRVWNRNLSHGASVKELRVSQRKGDL
jgi:hypothetical protein